MGCCLSGLRNYEARDRNEDGSRIRRHTGPRRSHKSPSTRFDPQSPTAHFSQPLSVPPTQPADRSPLQSPPPPSSSRRRRRSPRSLSPVFSPPVSQPQFAPASPSSSRQPLQPLSPASPQSSLPLTRRSPTSSRTQRSGQSSTRVHLVNPDSILDIPFENIRDQYTLVKLLGQSRFGPTFLCTENSTGHRYACKTISRKRLVQQSDRDDVRREAEIREYLSGRPYIAEFKDAYDDRRTVYLVMELCTGGDLYDLISSEGKYTERVIASIIRDIVNAVRVCHRKGVMHCDIKPENFLLSSEDEGAVLKAIDFRHSRYVKKGKEHRDPISTSYYLAPEAVDGPYGKEIDIWSAGVILYVLLSGVAPFYADTYTELRSVIKEGKIDFDRHPWPSISNSAKELTQMMLTVNPEQRISPKQVLDFPWIRDGEASDEPLDSAVLTRLKVFCNLRGRV